MRGREKPRKRQEGLCHGAGYVQLCLADLLAACWVPTFQEGFVLPRFLREAYPDECGRLHAFMLPWLRQAEDPTAAHWHRVLSRGGVCKHCRRQPCGPLIQIFLCAATSDIHVHELAALRSGVRSLSCHV